MSRHPGQQPPLPFIYYSAPDGRKLTSKIEGAAAGAWSCPNVFQFIIRHDELGGERTDGKKLDNSLNFESR